MWISDVMRHKNIENISLFICLSFAYLWLVYPKNFICLSFAKEQSDVVIISNICGKQDKTTRSLFACHLPDWHEAIKSGNGGGFMFDCRAMPNPYWDESLRGYTGRGKCCQCVNVASCQFQFPMENTWPYRILAIGNIGTGNIFTMAKLNTGRDHLQIAFGCTGGQHRSVYFAERMTDRLAGTDGVELEVIHTEVMRKIAKL